VFAGFQGERLADVWPLSEFEQAPEMFVLRFLIAHGGEEGGLPRLDVARIGFQANEVGVIRRNCPVVMPAFSRSGRNSAPARRDLTVGQPPASILDSLITESTRLTPFRTKICWKCLLPATPATIF
jgi:hypothetical protein